MNGLAFAISYAALSSLSLAARLWRKASLQEQEYLTATLTTLYKCIQTPCTLPHDAILHIVHSTVAHLRRSGISAFLLLNMISALFLLHAALVQVCLWGVAVYGVVLFRGTKATPSTQHMFLGSLTGIESAHMAERLLKFFMIKVVSLGAVVGPNIDQLAAWTAWVCMTGYLKAFFGLGRDRIEGIASALRPPRGTLTRTVMLMMVLLGELVAVTIVLVHVPHMMMPRGTPAGNRLGLRVRLLAGAPGPTSLLLLWGFDLVMVFLEAIHMLSALGLHIVAPAYAAWTRLRQQNHSIESHSIESGALWGSGLHGVAYHMGLLLETMGQVLTLLHYMHLWLLHGVSFQLIDVLLFMDVRTVAGQLRAKIHKYWDYWAVTWALQHRFQDAHPSFADDRECAICKEELVRAKVLPCKHVFHLHCLRAWLQRSAQQGPARCPLCRALLSGRDVERQLPRPSLWSVFQRERQQRMVEPPVPQPEPSEQWFSCVVGHSDEEEMDDACSYHSAVSSVRTGSRNEVTSSRRRY